LVEFETGHGASAAPDPDASNPFKTTFSALETGSTEADDYNPFGSPDKSFMAKVEQSKGMTRLTSAPAFIPQARGPAIRAPEPVLTLKSLLKAAPLLGNQQPNGKQIVAAGERQKRVVWSTQPATVKLYEEESEEEDRFNGFTKHDIGTRVLVRCAFLYGNVHLRMPLIHTPARLKRGCVRAIAFLSVSLLLPVQLTL
jgi:hypothetical protein